MECLGSMIPLQSVPSTMNNYFNKVNEPAFQKEYTIRSADGRDANLRGNTDGNADGLCFHVLARAMFRYPVPRQLHSTVFVS